MAKDNSFDVVSEVDLQEVDNAYQQASKGTGAALRPEGLGRQARVQQGREEVHLSAPSDFVAKQVIDVLNTKLVRRNVDLKAVHWSEPQAATGGSVRYTGTIVMGIETDLAKKINKDIKDEKFKAKVQIEGDKLRVSSASRDVLQDVITFLKEKDYGIPLQYTNYR
jgi:cyclic-di-GMP-binding protein